ncbi:MAG: 4'-phosphopantetheinyl transferase superfamily protein [Chloroflexi bacterium]|nr:4'-phosphopantetheinyl transferase superfamily protein [Chloroflexota bacterium]
MTIHWSLEAHHGLPTPAMLSALAPSEQDRYAALKTDKRRQDWLLGRWTAKRLVGHLWQAETGQQRPPETILVATEPGGAVALPDFPDWRLSISHSAGHAFCAVFRGSTVGADIERIAPRAPVFAADYFTTEECALVARIGDNLTDRLTTAIWSGKEAALKALRIGLTVDTRSVVCLGTPPEEGAWSPFSIRLDTTALKTISVPQLQELPQLQGWWRILDGFVLSLAAEKATARQ